MRAVVVFLLLATAGLAGEGLEIEGFLGEWRVDPDHADWDFVLAAVDEADRARRRDELDAELRDRAYRFELARDAFRQDRMYWPVASWKRVDDATFQALDEADKPIGVLVTRHAGVLYVQVDGSWLPLARTGDTKQAAADDRGHDETSLPDARVEFPRLVDAARGGDAAAAARLIECGRADHLADVRPLLPAVQAWRSSDEAIRGVTARQLYGFVLGRWVAVRRTELGDDAVALERDAIDCVASAEPTNPAFIAAAARAGLCEAARAESLYDRAAAAQRGRPADPLSRGFLAYLEAGRDLRKERFAQARDGFELAWSAAVGIRDEQLAGRAAVGFARAAASLDDDARAAADRRLADAQERADRIDDPALAGNIHAAWAGLHVGSTEPARDFRWRRAHFEKARELLVAAGDTGAARAALVAAVADAVRQAGQLTEKILNLEIDETTRDDLETRLPVFRAAMEAEEFVVADLERLRELATESGKEAIEQQLRKRHVSAAAAAVAAAGCLQKAGDPRNAAAAFGLAARHAEYLGDANLAALHFWNEAALYRQADGSVTTRVRRALDRSEVFARQAERTDILRMIADLRSR